MNEQQRKAMKLALEALKNITNYEGLADAREAIKEALEQPEQEPYFKFRECEDSQAGQPTPQRTWVGLTRDEQSFVYSSLHESTLRKDSFWVDFANAIEAKLREKNT